MWSQLLFDAYSPTELESLQAIEPYNLLWPVTHYASVGEAGHGSSPDFAPAHIT